MKKKNPDLELISKGLYREYEIAEWTDKCLILSEAEQVEILKCLSNGVETELVSQVRLPYPKFVESYYQKYPNATYFLKDPTFAYRLYIMREAIVTELNAKIKNPKEKHGNVTKSIRDTELIELLQTPFEQLTRIRTNREGNTEIERKYVYICQYIDAVEAERLGLKGFTFFTNGAYRGYDLEGKLNSLNDVARTIMSQYLGLYGSNRTAVSSISKSTRITENKIKELIGYLFDAFMMPTESLRSKIGYIPKDYQIGEFREYTRRDYRDLDLAIQIRYILLNVLNENERAVLENYSNSEVKAYITAKYIEPKKHKDSKPDFDGNNGGMKF